MSSAPSIDPESRYAKRKTGSRCRSYNSMKAAGSPAPAFSSKSSSVFLSGNRGTRFCRNRSYWYYQKKAKSYGVSRNPGFWQPQSNNQAANNFVGDSLAAFVLNARSEGAPGVRTGQYPSNQGVGCI